MKDILQAAYEHATATGTDLHAINGARVWRDTLPSGFDNSASAVVLQLVNGTRHYSAATQRAQVSARCYAATYDAARELALALNDRFHGVKSTVTEGELMTGVAGVPQPLPVDPANGWPLYQVTLQLVLEG